MDNSANSVLRMELTCESCRKDVVVLDRGQLGVGIQLIENSRVRASCPHCGHQETYSLRSVRTMAL
jgi:predicted RNA-binding Zn-ribbon protein involved in translation (DUF1610 family)